jgi:hypothetical protein
MMIKLSSPNIKQGVLYNIYKKRHELPDSYLILKAASWVFNNRLPQEILEREHKVDPDNFDREYRANFTDSISTFISPEAVNKVVMKDVTLIPPASRSEGVNYFAAIDAAFKGDRFTFTIMGKKDNRVTQYLTRGWEGTKENPVKAYDVAKELSVIVKEYKLDMIWADQFAFQPLKEIFQKFNVTLQEETFTNTFKKKIYYNFKSAIHSNTIDLLDHPETITEIKQLQVEQSATGTIKIGHPIGGSDDFSDSAAVALYKATNGEALADLGDFSMSPYQDIRTDASGRAIDAPTAEMVGQLQGMRVIDNIGDFYKDEDGNWKKVSEMEEEDDEGGGSFSFS